MEEIARKIYIENRFLGPTVGAILLPQGTLLVDAPPLPEEGRSWRASITNMGSGMERLLVYLDAHPDRTLGGNVLDCPAIAQEEARRQFKKRAALFKNQPLHQGAAWEMAAPLSGVRWRHPMFSFSEEVHIYWGEEPVLLAHRPGPAPGAAWVICPHSRVVFVGDAVTFQEPPFFQQADLLAWLQTLDRLLHEHSDFLVVSARGGVVPTKAIRQHQQLLSEVQEQLERLAKKGAAPEDTADLVPAILSRYDFPADYQTLFETRLRSGLAMAFARQYRLNEPLSGDHEERNA